MRRTTFAALLALCFTFVFAFGASAQTKPFTPEPRVTKSYTTNGAVRPNLTCGIGLQLENAGGLIIDAAVANTCDTTPFSSSVNVIAEHCNVNFLGICWHHDETLPMGNLILTNTRNAGSVGAYCLNVENQFANDIKV